MDTAKLGAMLEAVKSQNLNLHSLLVIRNGHIVSESYFGSNGPNTRHELFSCTKSFIATLMGIAIDKGDVSGVGQMAADLLDGRTFQNESAAKSAMTLEHLLTMTTGLDWTEGDPTYRAMYGSRDWVRYVMDLPMRDQPGDDFNYCSGCSHVLSAIIQAKTRHEHARLRRAGAVPAAGHHRCALGCRQPGHPHRRLGAADHPARHGEAGLPLPARRRLGRAADRLIRMGEGCHREAYPHRWAARLRLPVVDLSAVGRGTRPWGGMGR